MYCTLKPKTNPDRPRRLGRCTASVAFALIMLSGCVTAPVRSSGGAVVEVNDEVTITARYLSRNEIEARYTERVIPFVAPWMLFTPAEFMVFELNVETTEPGAIIDTSEIELSFGDRSYMASTPSELRRFWQGTAIYDDITGFSRERFNRLINRELVTRSPLEKSGVAFGLAVFRGRRFPAEGRARITLPITSLSSGRVTRHRIVVPLAEIDD